MRNAIGGAWIYMIAIIFMVVLIAYISISINYNKTYQVSQQIITVVEEYEGLTPTAINRIAAIISNEAYMGLGTCEKGDNNESYIGISDGTASQKDESGRFQVCVVRKEINSRYYYTITAFMQFSLPVLGDLYDFRVSGETNKIRYPASSDKFN